MDPIDGAELELVCLCGFENFQRVVVQRTHPPIVTDFVACVGCRAMYFAPIQKPDPKPPLPGAEMRGIGGPAAADFKGPLFSGGGSGSTVGDGTPLDSGIAAAVARANKSKGRRR